MGSLLEQESVLNGKNISPEPGLRYFNIIFIPINKKYMTDMWLMSIITEVKGESKIILLWFIFLFKYEYLNVYVPWVQVSIEDNEHCHIS